MAGAQKNAESLGAALEAARGELRGLRAGGQAAVRRADRLAGQGGGRESALKDAREEAAGLRREGEGQRDVRGTLTRGLEAALGEIREVRGREAGLRAECSRLLESAAAWGSERERLEGELAAEHARAAESNTALERAQAVASGLRGQKEGLEARAAELEHALGVAEVQLRRQAARLKSLQSSQGFLHRQREASASAFSGPGRRDAAELRGGGGRRPRTCSAGVVTFGTL